MNHFENKYSSSFSNKSQKKAWLKSLNGEELDCNICRHENSEICNEFKRKQRYFERKGKPLKKKYCRFFSRKPFLRDYHG